MGFPLPIESGVMAKSKKQVVKFQDVSELPKNSVDFDLTELDFSPTAESLVNQLKRFGVKNLGPLANEFQQSIDALVLLNVRSLLTDQEFERISDRLRDSIEKYLLK